MSPQRREEAEPLRAAPPQLISCGDACLVEVEILLGFE